MKSKQLESFKLSVILFAALFVLHAVVYMTKNMFSAAMASIVETGVMTKSQTGAISAAFWLVYAVSQIIGGFAADKYSPFKMICIGIISGIVSNFIIYYNQNYALVMVVWCINAALQFGLWPGLFKIVTTQVCPAFRSTAIFWVLLSTSAGQAISLLVASVMTDWVNNFLVSAIALAVLLVLWVVLYKFLEGRMVEVTIEPRTKKKTDAPAMELGALARSSGLAVLVVISFFATTVSNGIKTVTPVMLMESYERLPAAIATRMSVFLIVFAVLGMFLAGGFRRKVTQNEMRAILIFVSACVPFLALSYTVGKWHYILILAFLSFAIVFLQAATPFSNSFAAARFTPYGRSGTVSGILNACAALGNVFASFIFPWMAETLPWNGVVLFWVICVLLVLVLAFALLRKWTAFIEKA